MQRPKETFKEKIAKELTLKKFKSHCKEALIVGMQYAGWMEMTLALGLIAREINRGKNGK